MAGGTITTHGAFAHGVVAFGDATFTLILAYHREPILRAPLQVVAFQNQPVDQIFQTWNTATGFSATNLPAGLVLDPTAGHLTGTPSGYGYSMVAITTNEFRRKQHHGGQL